MKLTGGLWKKTTKDGRVFLTGPGPMGTQIFVNLVENKQSEKSPDYIITIETPRERDEKPKQGGNFGEEAPF